MFIYLSLLLLIRIQSNKSVRYSNEFDVFARTINGEIYAWGDNGREQLGIENDKNDYLYNMIKTLNSKSYLYRSFL